MDFTIALDISSDKKWKWQREPKIKCCLSFLRTVCVCVASAFLRVSENCTNAHAFHSHHLSICYLVGWLFFVAVVVVVNVFFSSCVICVHKKNDITWVYFIYCN